MYKKSSIGLQIMTEHMYGVLKKLFYYFVKTKINWYIQLLQNDTN